MRIENAARLALNIPFNTRRVERAMHRATTHDERVYVYRVETDDGVVGYGESMSLQDVDCLLGGNPFALMNDDRVGFGPQVAALDAAGKSAGVPVHALLGTKVRNGCPIAWWAIDMPPADWSAEALESIKRGYTCFKMKARPWRDIIGQVDAVGKVVPRDYRFHLDFNGFLLNPARAELVLAKLDEHPNVGLYESPFYLMQDLAGARMLRQRVRKPVIEHFREACLLGDCCDGFAGGGTASRARQQNALAAALNKPFWLQLVGTGITTAFAAHLGAVLSHAHLSYVTCHELWKHDLLRKRLKVQDGFIDVPDAPGLGIEVDEKALDKYRVDPDEPTPKTLYRRSKRILRISWPGAGKERRVWEFTDEERYQKEFYLGNIPAFQPGVSLEVIEDDKSAAFRRRHKRLLEREGRIAWPRSSDSM